MLYLLILLLNGKKCKDPRGTPQETGAENKKNWHLKNWTSCNLNANPLLNASQKNVSNRSVLTVDKAISSAVNSFNV